MQRTHLRKRNRLLERLGKECSKKNRENRQLEQTECKSSLVIAICFWLFIRIQLCKVSEFRRVTQFT